MGANDGIRCMVRAGGDVGDGLDDSCALFGHEIFGHEMFEKTAFLAAL